MARLSASAVKAGEAYVTLSARTSTLMSGLTSAQSKFRSTLGKMRTRAVAFSRAVSRQMKIVGVAMVGALALAFRAAGKQEQADLKLAKSLEILGKYSKETYDSLKAFASEMQEVANVGDEVVEGLMSMGMNLGELSGTRLKEATRAAIGLAEVLEKDVNTTMMLVSRAAQGQFDLFTRYGIQLDTNMTAQEKWTVIMEKGAKGFGIVTAKAQTALARITAIKNTFGDLLEKVGFAIFEKEGTVDGLNAINEKLKDWQVWVDANQSKIKGFFTAIGNAAKAAYNQAKLLIDSLKALKLGMDLPGYYAMQRRVAAIKERGGLGASDIALARKQVGGLAAGEAPSGLSAFWTEMKYFKEGTAITGAARDAQNRSIWAREAEKAEERVAMHLGLTPEELRTLEARLGTLSEQLEANTEGQGDLVSILNRLNKQAIAEGW